MKISGWTPAAVRQLVCIAGLSGAMGAEAHHSYTEFDATQTVEIEGTLLALAWQNPQSAICIAP